MLSRKSTSRDRLAAVGYNRHGAMGRFWHGLHRHALMTMIAYAFLQHFRIAKTGRKNETTATTSAQPASRASRHRRSHSSAIRSAIRVLQNTGQRRARCEQICQSRVSAHPKHLMIMQETGDPRLQHGGVVRFARGRVLEEPALDVSRQIIPFADKGGTQTFQDSALHIAQIAGFIG